MAETEKKYIYITLAAFILFAAVYSFILIDDSYYNLEGDATNVGSWIYRDTCKEEFKNDPMLLQDHTFYLPTHLGILILFFKISGSYIFSLQILLFFQIFLTLSSTTYVLRRFFPEADYLQTVLLASFIALVYVKIPQIENVGFYGLKTATARSSMGIFLPLLALFYYKGKNFSIGKIKIPNILWVCILTAILANLHPQTSIMLFVVFLIHYFISIPKTKDNFRKIILICIVSSPFILLFLSLATKHVFGQNLWEYITSVFATLSWLKNKLFFNKRFYTFDSLWLTQITYLPYVFIVLIFFLYKKSLPKDKRFIFLKNMFLIAFFIHIILGGLGYNILFFSRFTFAQIFMRGSRVAFFFMEILAVYFILYGKNYIRSRKTHLLLSIGILFFLFMLSDSRLEINSGFLDAIPGFINLTQIEETLLLRLMSILGFIALAILIAVKKGNAYILAGYCSAMLFIWPLLCGTLKMKAGEIMDQTYAFGSWRLASKFTNSTNAYEIDQYAELIDWTRKSSRQNDFFYTFVSETLGQKLKLATLRPGLGDLRDNSLYCKDGARLAIIMERIIKEFSAKDNKYKIFKETLKKYNVNYIVIDKELYGNVVDKLSNMPVAFQNKKYIVYTANSDKL